jgi:glycosyltransferase involved in cell wall biosynthesis
MSDPLVTVGLPVYQGEEFIDEAIRSIRSQTHGDLELIISDNGSTDATEEICRTHASEDGRIRYHRSPVNRGSSWNYCRLVNLARGTYFKWASHDDVLLPTYLERCVDVLQAHDEVVLVQTAVAEIDHRGAELRRFPLSGVATRGGPGRRFSSVVLREGPCFPVFGLTRLGVLRRTGLLGPYNGHDRPLLAELALHGRYVHLPEKLFLSREHPGRSIRAYRGYRDRIAWFDPSLEGRVVYGHPRLLLEYHRAVVRSSPTLPQAVVAESTVLVWAISKLPSFLRDVIGGQRAHLSRFLSKGMKDSRSAVGS